MSKAGGISPEGIIFLTRGSKGSNTTNFDIWSKSLVKKNGKILGKMVDVVMTGVAMVLAPFTDEEVGIPGIVLSQADKDVVRKGKLLSHLKKGEELGERVEKLFYIISDTLSLEAQSVVEMHESYDDAFSKKDGNLLAKIVFSLHAGSVWTHSSAMLAISRCELLHKHRQLRQGAEETPVNFLQRVLALEKQMLDMGCHDVPLDEEDQKIDKGIREALEFLFMLDAGVYRELYNDIYNTAMKTNTLPTSRNEVYTYACMFRNSNTKSDNSKVGGPTTEAAFLAGTDSSQSSKATKQPPRATTIAEERALRQEAEKKLKALIAASKKSADKTAGSSSDTETNKHANIKCFKCQLKGHFASDCTTVDDAAKDGAKTDRAGKRRQKKRDKEESAMLCDSETEEEGFIARACTEQALIAVDKRLADAQKFVVFDSASSASLFRGKDVTVEDGKQSRTVFIGVNGKGPSLKVDVKGVIKENTAFGRVNVSKDAAANLASETQLQDSGHTCWHMGTKDDRLSGRDTHVIKFSDGTKMTFRRRFEDDGKLAGSYTSLLSGEDSLAGTVQEQETETAFITMSQARGAMSRRDLKKVDEVAEINRRMGDLAPVQLAKTILRTKGVSVTAHDVNNFKQLNVITAPRATGHTRVMQGKAVDRGVESAPRVVQAEQSVQLDIMFLRNSSLAFLIAVILPLGLVLVMFVKHRTSECVLDAINAILSVLASRNFDAVSLRCDGEKAITPFIRVLLQAKKLVCDICGPGQHCPNIESTIKAVKNKVRGQVCTLPFNLSRLMLICLVMHVVACMNRSASTTREDGTPAMEAFTGRVNDAKLHFRGSFGDMLYATRRESTNSIDHPRTEECMYLYSTANFTGSVAVYRLSSDSVVVRDQFVIVPTSDASIAHMNKLAAAEGYVRTMDIDEPIEKPVHNARTPREAGVVLDEFDEDELAEMEKEFPTSPQHRIMPVIGRPTIAPTVPYTQPEAASIAALGGIDAGDVIGAAVTDDMMQNIANDSALRRSGRRTLPVERYEASFYVNQMKSADVAKLIVDDAERDHLRGTLRRSLVSKQHWHNTEFAFRMTVKAAMKGRPKEAEPAIIAELEQMLKKGVFHGVSAKHLSQAERKAILRTSMFLKDKYLASGAFDKFKARLVGGGDMQDHHSYENLSSPTAATRHVFSVAAIAAHEGRKCATIDIGGAFLNADIRTGIKVHVRLDATLARLLALLDDSYAEYLEKDGTMIVQLDKALYGCIESAALWYHDLVSKLSKLGFTANPYDLCVFNKLEDDGWQTTIALHVDDMLVTSMKQAHILALNQQLQAAYGETTFTEGDVLDYLGMTFDFTVAGEVSVTMDHAVSEILRDAGEDIKKRTTPATDMLFVVRDDAQLSKESERVRFHSTTAKLLYVCKRVRPECLTAVSFLTTRVHKCDTDDLAKLDRVLGYILATKDRGVTLRIGEHMGVKAYIDAAYGVHTSTGRSHTGCCIVLGMEGRGPVESKSCKQKSVTKSSTEAELMSLSDMAGEVMHLRNFIIHQGYEVGPAILYQDNLSCMALMKKGGPTSERSRHILLRHFWLAERVGDKEVIIEHLSTADMIANALTKPVQGAQFLKERAGLTNWRT